MFPYTQNNATFGIGNDHISLRTSNYGTLIARDNGECELSNGPDNRAFEKYSSIFFWTCYCKYTKVSPNSNSTSSTRYLRTVDISDFTGDSIRDDEEIIPLIK